MPPPFGPLVTVNMGCQIGEVESTEVMECWEKPLELERTAGVLVAQLVGRRS